MESYVINGETYGYSHIAPEVEMVTIELRNTRMQLVGTRKVHKDSLPFEYLTLFVDEKLRDLKLSPIGKSPLR